MTFCLKSIFFIMLLCGNEFAIVKAAPMCYVFKATGSGFLGDSTFTNTTFTILSVADVNQIKFIANGIYQVSNMVATLAVSNFALASFTNSTIIAQNENLKTIGFSDVILHRGVLFVSNSIFGNYNLGKPVGPYFGVSDFSLNTQIPTTIGDLMLTMVTNSSFQSVLINQPKIIYYAHTPAMDMLVATNCIVGAIYTMQENTNLSTTNWTTVSTASATGSALTNGFANFNFKAHTNTASSFLRILF